MRIRYQHFYLTIFITALSLTSAVHGLHKAGCVTQFEFTKKIGAVLAAWAATEWYRRDAYLRGESAIWDLGLFMYVAMPIALPLYLWRTRGIGTTVAQCVGAIALCCVVAQSTLAFGQRFMLCGFQGSDDGISAPQHKVALGSTEPRMGMLPHKGGYAAAMSTGRQVPYFTRIRILRL